ncbi:MAG: sigma-70 family RNA polymerase sigma factor [Candidatus Poribacteria bacterium]
MQSQSDQRLIYRAQHGDADAFGVLMDRYASHVYAIAVSQMLNHADAQDISQDAFLRAYTRLRQLRDPSGFVGWLSRITVTCARNRQRRDGREIALRDAAARPNIQPPDQEQFERHADTHDILMGALGTLSLTFRQPLVLRYMDDMPYAEIARCLSITPQTAQRRVSRAREKLADYFRRSGQDIECMDVLRSGALVGPAAFGWLRGALDAVRAQGAPDAPPSASPVGKYAPYGIAAAVVGSGMFAVTAGPLLSLFVAQHSSPPADPWTMAGTASVSARAASEMPAYVYDPRPLGSPGLPYSGIGDPDPAGIADAVGIDLSTLTGVVATTRLLGNEAHIWLTGVDGSTERQLTFGAHRDTAAALSPDGEWIAFMRITSTGGKPDIWKVRASGGAPVRVTDDPDYASNTPTWHPSGQTIAFARSPWVEGRALPYKDRVWSVSASGGIPRMISRDTGLSVLDPEYSADGTSILVTAESERQQFAIQRIDLATGDARELVSYAGGEHTPTLSPDGREIVFASARGATVDIYRADVDGSNITQLTDGPSHVR